MGRVYQQLVADNLRSGAEVGLVVPTRLCTGEGVGWVGRVSREEERKRVDGWWCLDEGSKVLRALPRYDRATFTVAVRGGLVGCHVGLGTPCSTHEGAAHFKVVHFSKF